MIDKITIEEAGEYAIIPVDDLAALKWPTPIDRGRPALAGKEDK